MKKFLKVGEFARICQTTRDTLLHYARKGLLQPRYTAENGYRFYALEQFWEFSLISLLFHCGDTQSHETAFHRLLKHMKAEHLGIGSDIYIYDQMNYLMQMESGRYMAKYMVRLEKPR